MNKIKLYIHSENNTEDIFKFNTLSELFEFINNLTVEKLIDNDYAELKYNILVEG